MGDLRSIVAQGLVADASMKGPTSTSNYVVPGRILMGNDPVGGGRLQALLSRGVRTFVDLRDGAHATNYVASHLGGSSDVEYIHFEFHCEDYSKRQKQLSFMYHLLDRAHSGDVMYIHDTSGHGRCGVVAGCLLAALYGFPGMKCLNMVSQLHAVRDNTEGADCPSDCRSQELKAYVKEIARDIKYNPGAGADFAAVPPPRQGSPARSTAAHATGAHGGGAASINIFGESPSKQQARSAGGRFQSSEGKSGGGTTSINIFGGGDPGSQASTPQKGTPQKGTPRTGGYGAAAQQGGYGAAQQQPAAASPARAAQQSPSYAAGAAPSPLKSGRGRSCGGGAHQINIFGEADPPLQAKRSVRAAGPPGSVGGGSGASAAALITQQGGQRQRAPPQQQQQQQQQEPPSPPQSNGARPAAPLPAGAVTLTMQRPGPGHPWGLQLGDGMEICALSGGSPAERAGCPCGRLVAVDGQPIEDESGLHLLGGARTSVQIAVVPSAGGAQRGGPPAPLHDSQGHPNGEPSGDPRAFALRRTPGQPWGVDVEDLWVVGVQEGSPAHAAGVPCGRLVAINDTELQDMSDCHLLSGAHECTLWIIPDQHVSPPPGAPEDAAPAGPIELPEPFDTRNKADLATAKGPTRTSNWVIRGRLLAGAAPDPRHRGQLEALANSGVTTFVNLRTGDERQASYFEHVQRFAPDRRLQLLELGMCDGAAPNRSVKETKDFIALVRECCDRVLRGEVLYVHCKGGHGRTGMVVACMLGILYGMPSMRALNSTDALHSQRDDTEDQCSPQTQEQRIFVLEALKAMQAGG